MLIAGDKSATGWAKFRILLVAKSDADIWQEAARDYFHARLALRYLEPIECLQSSGTFRGEGFSIATIQCSLVEFLESTVQGINYRYRRPGQSLGAYEYSESGRPFTQFLTARAPFAVQFSNTVARDFYVGVLCGLLHEARTTNGWQILGRSGNHRLIDPGRKIMLRDDFQAGLLAFVSRYEAALIAD